VRRLAVAVLVLLGLVACSNDKNDSASATTTSSAAVSTTTTAPSPFGATPVSTPESTPQVILTKVDVARHDGFERVVFRFRDADDAIGFAVSIAKPPFTQDGSGKTMQVGGSGHIAVRIIGAAHDDNGNASYPDGERIKGSDAIAEVVRVGDFEGVVSFVIGTNGDRPFRAFTLKSPARLVVDVAGA
jgi:hypothetical protein